jgi:putative transposase
LCAVLEVSRSGFYDWANRGRSPRRVTDDELLEQIRKIHQESRGTYGSPRVHAELAARGWRVGRKRVARLMRAAGLVGAHRRRRVSLTVAERAAVIPDRVARNFGPRGRPGQRWVGDISYLPTATGWLYLATVLDLATRKIVGYAMAEHMRAELVCDALTMAVRRCPPAPGCVFHSDRGSQYTSAAFADTLAAHQITGSTGRTGSCFDNAVAESFFATLKCEIGAVSWTSRSAARMAVYEWIEVFYNRTRRHSALNYDTPHDTERRLLTETAEEPDAA